MVMFAIFAGVLVLLLLGVTTAVTMGFASIATFLMAGGDMARLFLVPQRMFSQVSGITLMSIPFFLLMGNLMSVGGISKSLFGFGRVCLGHRAGGLSNAAIVACIVMAAMSGSAAACAAGIGMIAIAEMTKSGYDRAFSCATIAAGGALGPIIPPSITLILFAGLTQTSVNALFAAGAVPGVLLGLAFMLWSSYVCKKEGYTVTPKASWSERWTGFKDAFWSLLTPVIVIGGMFAGHNESGGEVIEKDGKKMRAFYGMSSKAAMDKYSGGVAHYRAAEGKIVYINDRGPVDQTCQDILGGVRSACTYVGARKLKELTMRTTFVRVTQQLNEIFGKS